MTDLNTNSKNKQLKIFMLVTFLLTYGMGILMGVSKSLGIDVTSFVNVQMLYPAFGAIVAILLTTEDKSSLPLKYYYSYILLTILGIIFLIIGVVIKNINFVPIDIIIIAMSAIGWIFYFIEDKIKRRKYSLSPKHKNKGVKYILLFLALYFFRIGISLIFDRGTDLGEIFNFNKLIILLFMPVNFILSYIAFFGEEYGWRGFLQPHLQEKFGNIKGLIILGVIWGIWHLPVNIFFYSPETWVLSVINQQIVCITYSIFFGYAYMKSKNIWVPIIIHFLNNNLIILFADPSAISNQVLNLSAIAFMFITSLIFVPFAFSKVFKEEKPETMPLEVEEEYFIK